LAGVTLAESIGRNTTLTSLYLYNNSIGMAAARGIGEAFRHGANAKELRKAAKDVSKVAPAVPAGAMGGGAMGEYSRSAPGPLRPPTPLISSGNPKNSVSPSPALQQHLTAMAAQQAAGKFSGDGAGDGSVASALTEFSGYSTDMELFSGYSSDCRIGNVIGLPPHLSHLAQPAPMPLVQRTRPRRVSTHTLLMHYS
jgi:hypothetical protein